MNLRIRVGDVVVQLAARRSQGERGQFKVQIDDTTLEVGAQELPDGSLLLDLGSGRQVRAEVSRLGDARWVTVAGRTALMHRVEEGGLAVEATEALLEAPMPGKVVALAVGPGDQVTAGQSLVVVEAMKMEHPIRASRDGVVATVEVAVGDMVNPGLPLVTLEDDT